ncbi:MAG: acetolactate synthase large subunit [Opitutaceae bacterium]
MKTTGAEIVITLLERQGIHTIAGLPGGANLPLYDALGRSGQIRHVLARHEQGAGFIAQGMARASGETAVCFATSGPGATNIMTALADAKLDSIPIVCITGQVPTSLIGTDAFQEIDTYGMSLPATKHNYLVRSARELLEVIPEAFRLAASGRPGPVLIDVPKDVQLESIEVSAWPEPGQRVSPGAPTTDAIIEAARLIAESRTPILYLGGGIIHSNAAGAARRLAEKADLPVTQTLMALGAFPHDHPLSLGMLGMHAARFTHLALEECDLLIAAGARFDDRATGRLATFCPRAKVIHIDIDPSEIHKLRRAEVAIEGDVGLVLEAIADLLPVTTRPDWRQSIAGMKASSPPAWQFDDLDPGSPYALIRSVAALTDDETVVTTDVGQHQMWVAQAYPFRQPRRWLTSGGLGTMGFGLPAAIGAALAEPGRPVICFSGDGSFLMNNQELATAAEWNLPVKIVLFNNQGLGLVHQQQHLFYGRRFQASLFQNRVDFPALARAFGVRALDLATTPDPWDRIAEEFLTPGPCLIHVPMNIENRVFPMVPPGGANKDTIENESHALAHN